MNNELMEIIEEIKGDIKAENPCEINFEYKYEELQIKFNGFNWSSYYVTSEQMKILALELKEIKLPI